MDCLTGKNPEIRINPENLHPCLFMLFFFFVHSSGSAILDQWTIMNQKLHNNDTTTNDNRIMTINNLTWKLNSRFLDSNFNALNTLQRISPLENNLEFD